MKRAALTLIFLLAAFFPAFNIPLPASAADPNVFELSLTELASVVVTDTKIAQSQKTVTQKIELADPAGIERQTELNRNLSELLAYRPGLSVNVLSRNDANWGSFGGLGPKYNGYLLDGLPIDSFVDPMSLDPWIFDRIELYKGPASVMYSNYLSMDFAGNQTPLTGITNFVIRDAVEGRKTRVRMGGGSYGTWNGKIYHQDRRGRLDYFLGGNYERSDYANYGASGSWLNILRDPGYARNSLYAKTSWSFGRDDHKITLFAHRSRNRGDVGRPNRDFDHGYDTLNLAYTNQISQKLNIQLKGGFRGYDRYWGEDNYPADLGLKNHSGVEQRIFPFDLSFNYKHRGESVLTFGADAQTAGYRTYSESAAGAKATDMRVSSFSRGLFLQEKLVRDKWVFRAGGRVNRIEHSYDRINGAAPAGDPNRSWSRPLWSFGARYNKSSRLALYGNAGTSFAVPSAKQIWGTAGGQLPNPGIGEETGLGADLGLEWRPNGRLAVGVRGLVNKIDNAIIDNVVSLNPSRTQSVNAGKARSVGFELTVEQRVSENTQWFANLTRISSGVSNPLDADNDGTRIPFVPDYTANAGVTMNLTGEVAISPYIRMIGNYYDSTSRAGRRGFGPYQTVNVKIRKGIGHKPGCETSAFVDLNNLMNRRFEMPWQFADPGFNAFAGIETRF